MSSSRRRAAPTSEQEPDEARINTRRGLVEQEIYVQATRLFAERGFSGTSFQDIADAVGLTRPALYHYVRSKDELLAKLVAEITQDAAVDIETVAHREDLGAAEKLVEIMVDLVRRQGEHADRFRLLVRSEADLPEEIAATQAAGRRAVLAALAGVIEDGVAEGVFRPVEPRIAALGLLGTANWVAWWYQPGGRYDLDQVCAELSATAVNGLRAEGDVRPVASAEQALDVLREDLDRLARLLPGS